MRTRRLSWPVGVLLGALTLAACKEGTPGGQFIDTVGPEILNPIANRVVVIVFGTGGRVVYEPLDWDCGPLSPTVKPENAFLPSLYCRNTIATDVLTFTFELDPDHGSVLLGADDCVQEGDRVRCERAEDSDRGDALVAEFLFDSRPVPVFKAHIGSEALSADLFAAGESVVVDSPATVNFNACPSWDPDNAPLYWSWDFEGEGFVDLEGGHGGFCRPVHEYRVVAGQTRTFRPRVCVVDRIGEAQQAHSGLAIGTPIREPLCKEYEITVRGPASAPTPPVPPSQPPVISGLTVFPPSVFNGGDPFEIEFTLDDPDGDRIDWSLSDDGTGGSTCAPTSGSVTGSGSVIVNCTSGGVEVITYTVTAVDENGAAAIPMSVAVDVF